MYSIHLHGHKPDGESGQQLENTRTLTEAEVIRLAVKSGGKLSVASLCMKAKTNTEAAEQILNKLQEKNIFELVINTHGTIYYELSDKELIRKR